MSSRSQESLFANNLRAQGCSEELLVKFYMNANAGPGPQVGGSTAKGAYCYIFSDSIC